MSLEESKPTLESDIITAYQNAKTNGEGGMSPDDVISTLANEIAEAIHLYTTSAEVNTDTFATIDGGSMASTYPVVGTTTGTGFGTLS